MRSRLSGKRRRFKIKKVRPITGRSKIKGWKTRLNRRPETKYTTYAYANGNNVFFPIRNWTSIGQGAVMTRIFSCNTLDDQGVGMIQHPRQGDAGGNIDGIKYNSLYAEVCFDIYKRPDVADQNLSDMIRIFCVRQRDRAIPLDPTNIFTVQARPNAPIAAKIVDIQMDKFYSTTTGYSPAGLAYTSLWPKTKRFRMIIPLRHTMNLQPNINTANAFPLDISIFAFSLGTDNVWVVSNLNVTYYFRDP